MYFKNIPLLYFMYCSNIKAKQKGLASNNIPFMGKPIL
jgi:hypothetical protein